MNVLISVVVFLSLGAALCVPVLPARILPDPLRRTLLRWGAAVKGLILGSGRRARTLTGDAADRALALAARIGFGATLLLFAAFTLRLGFLTRNAPDSALGVLAAALAALVIVTGAAYVGLAALLIPGWVRGQGLLRRIGLGGAWAENAREWSPSLREAVDAHIRTSRGVCILDITGRDLLSRGTGPAGGLLLDALAACPNVPAQVLVLAPEANAADPDQRRASVFQALLAELDCSSATYIQCLRATLAAVESLNTGRSPETRVELRLYTEKPEMRMALFDGAALVSPWPARNRDGETTWLEALRSAELPSLHEVCRRHFSRLWASAASVSEVRMTAAGSMRLATPAGSESARKARQPAHAG